MRADARARSSGCCGPACGRARSIKVRQRERSGVLYSAHGPFATTASCTGDHSQSTGDGATDHRAHHGATATHRSIPLVPPSRAVEISSTVTFFSALAAVHPAPHKVHSAATQRQRTTEHTTTAAASDGSGRSTAHGPRLPRSGPYAAPRFHSHALPSLFSLLHRRVPFAFYQCFPRCPHQHPGAVTTHAVRRR